MEDMNILAFFLSYPSLPIDASDESSEEAIKRGDEFRTYIWGEMGTDVLLKSLSYIDYGKDLKRILFQFYIMPCDYERIHIKEIEQYRKKEKAIGIPIIVVITIPINIAPLTFLAVKNTTTNNPIKVRITPFDVKSPIAIFPADVSINPPLEKPSDTM